MPIRTAFILDFATGSCSPPPTTAADHGVTPRADSSGGPDRIRSPPGTFGTCPNRGRRRNVLPTIPLSRRADWRRIGPLPARARLSAPRETLGSSCWGTWNREAFAKTPSNEADGSASCRKFWCHTGQPACFRAISQNAGLPSSPLGSWPSFRKERRSRPGPQPRSSRRSPGLSGKASRKAA
jgi:hypothetical protein